MPTKKTAFAKQLEELQKAEAMIAKLKEQKKDSPVNKFSLYEAKSTGNKFLKVDIGAGRYNPLLTRETANKIKELSKHFDEALDAYGIE